jgi:hypothetical protein
VDRWELKERLVTAGVPDGNYFIVGIDSQQTPGQGGGFGELVLTRTEDEQGWRLVTEERGRLQSERIFGTEDEACAAAWAELKPFDTPVRTRSPEERAAARAQARAREMVAEYDQIEPDYRGRGGQQS